MMMFFQRQRCARARLGGGWAGASARLGAGRACTAAPEAWPAAVNSPAAQLPAGCQPPPKPPRPNSCPPPVPAPLLAPTLCMHPPPAPTQPPRCPTLTSRLPSVVEYYGAFCDDARLYIVMEHCGGGDLLEKLLRDKKAMSERRVAVEVAQPCLAILRTLHEMRIIHRCARTDGDEESGPGGSRAERSPAAHFSQPAAQGAHTSTLTRPPTAATSSWRTSSLTTRGA